MQNPRCTAYAWQTPYRRPHDRWGLRPAAPDTFGRCLARGCGDSIGRPDKHRACHGAGPQKYRVLFGHLTQARCLEWMEQLKGLPMPLVFCDT